MSQNFLCLRKSTVCYNNIHKTDLFALAKYVCVLSLIPVYFMNILHYVTLRGVTNDCIVVPLQCIYRHNCANTDKNFHLHLLVDKAVPILLHITAILIENMTKALKYLASFCTVLIKIKQMPRGLLAILTKVEQVFIYR